ncbi:DNA methyltransferase [Candidatus Spongiihabitans sp.]|uniref:DNA methyltransferase n=1 Tax=Candidatus Spongiihabitans sp. TaxID=3101308 RepID=UPI003C6F0B70
MQSQNKIYVGDNLSVLMGMNSRTVDLIYLDPPFNSKRIYRVPIGTPAGKKEAGFDDIWVWSEDIDIRLEAFLDKYPRLFRFIGSAGEIHGLPMKAYLTFMAQRMIEMHRVLKETGSLYLHCDPTAGHYLKIMLDEVFGKHNFRNEIAWAYKTGGVSKRHFSRKHDVVFFYSKGREYVFNLQKEKSYLSHKYGFKNIEILSDDGGTYRYVHCRDIWDIPALRGNQPEVTGYPTQKPLALLDRIIKASSNEGDLVLDPFCGCATTCVAAHRLQRNWIGIDVSDVAVDLVRDRLTDATAQGLLKSDDVKKEVFTDFLATDKPPMRTDIVKTKLKKPQIKKILFDEQEGVCNGCKKEFDLPNFHLDHIVPKSKGGGDYMENFQLLCGNCNSIKGDRPMEYLQYRMRIQKNLTPMY